MGGARKARGQCEERRVFSDTRAHGRFVSNVVQSIKIFKDPSMLYQCIWVLKSNHGISVRDSVYQEAF